MLRFIATLGECLQYQLKLDTCIHSMTQQSTSRNMPTRKRAYVYHKICTGCYSSITCSGLKLETTQIFINRRMSKFMQYYITMRKNNLWLHTATWMNLIKVMLVKRNQTQKSTYCVISLLQSLKTGKTNLVVLEIEEWFPLERNGD